LDVDKAFSVPDGMIVDEDNDGPFYTGGATSPIGQGLPFNTVYCQTLAAGQLIWKKVGAGDTASDWRKYSAQDVGFADGGSTFKSASTNVKLALEELRTTSVLPPEIVTTTLNGTRALVAADNTFVDVGGTATGFKVKLPVATTLKLGRAFEVINDSSEPIDFQLQDGTSVITLNPQDVIKALCQHKDTANGEWIFTVTSNSATGILSSFVETDTLFSTGSDTDVMITGMTLTPVDGRYAVWFSADTKIVTNNRVAEVVMYVDGVADEATRRSTQGVSVNFLGSAQSLGIISVDGTQAIDIRTNVTGGTVEFTGRSMLLVRLGASA